MDKGIARAFLYSLIQNFLVSADWCTLFLHLLLFGPWGLPSLGQNCLFEMQPLFSSPPHYCSAPGGLSLAPTTSTPEQSAKGTTDTVYNVQSIAGMLMTRKVTPSTKMLLQMMIKLQCAHQSTFRTHASFRMSISLKTTVDTFVMMSPHIFKENKGGCCYLFLGGC